MLPRYGGMADPRAFLLPYEEALLKAEGDDKAMANWLPLALTEAPRSWLCGLPRASISSWEELYDQFIA